MGSVSTRVCRLAVVTGIVFLLWMTMLIIPASSAQWQETFRGAGEIRINAFTHTPVPTETDSLPDTSTPAPTFAVENEPTMTPLPTNLIPTEKEDEEPTPTIKPTKDDGDPPVGSTGTATPTPPEPVISPASDPEEMPSATPTEYTYPTIDPTMLPTEILPVFETPPIPILLTQIPEWLKTPSPNK